MFRFSKEGSDYIVKNRPGSDLGGLVRFVRKIAGVQESPGPVPAERNGPATFPTFRLGYALPQTARIELYKTSPDPIWFWLTASGLGCTVPVRKQADVQESSGPLLANASGPIRVRSGMFTGSGSCFIIGLPIVERCSVRYVP